MNQLFQTKKTYLFYCFAADSSCMDILASSDLQSEAYKNSVRADLDKYLEKWFVEGY